jgi:hypothetical protein
VVTEHSSPGEQRRTERRHVEAWQGPNRFHEETSLGTVPFSYLIVDGENAYQLDVARNTYTQRTYAAKYPIL